MMKLDEWTVNELEQADQLDFEEEDGVVRITRELGYEGRSGCCTVTMESDVFYCSDCDVQVDWMRFECKASFCGDHDDVAMGVGTGGVFYGP